MSESIERGNRVCVGLPTGEVCALSPQMELVTDRGPIKAAELKKLWRNEFFEWVELPTMMRISREAEHEWQEDARRDTRGDLTVRNRDIAYVAQEVSDD